MSTREEIMTRIHKLSCKHEHKRADECGICMREFEPIIQELIQQSSPLEPPKEDV